MKKLFKLAIFAGLVAGVAKLAQAKKAEWSGLSEAQVREKLDTTIGRKVDDPVKMAEISDKVVAKMKERGMIDSAPAEEGNGGASVDAADEAAAEE
jgi:hypothetical protein